MRLLLYLSLISVFISSPSFASSSPYKTIFNHARVHIAKILKTLDAEPSLPAEPKLIFLSKVFSNLPYIHAGTGEGDWLQHAKAYQPGGKHHIPLPVYRTDGFDCVSYVQTILALLAAHDLKSFDRAYIHSAYGAKDFSASVSFDNRNHFVDGDWNRVNEKNGSVADATTSGAFSRYAKIIQVNINRAQWKQFQQAANPNRNLKKSSVDVRITYLPKEILFANAALLNQLPTPAVVEIIRDPKKWFLKDKPIANTLGSETSVSHMGIIYRQQFKLGETIYKRIHCTQQKKFCTITPVFCGKQNCSLIMFSHATDGYPKKHDQFNRVEHLPLLQYFTDTRDGNYNYMRDESILGLHIEKINTSRFTK